MLFRQYDPLAVPKPDPEFKYYWGSMDLQSPDYIGSLRARGYQIVRDTEAEKLGFDTASLVDGGLLDKGNHRISTGRLVLMKIPIGAYEDGIKRKNEEMLRVIGRETSTFERNAEKLGALLET